MNLRTYSSNTSKNKRKHLRKKESFETRAETIARTEKQNAKLKAGKIKPKSHGNIHNYDWKWRECLTYFKEKEYGSKVNWKKSAEFFGLKDRSGKALGNGGQLLKRYLEDNGIDTSRFESVRGEVKIIGRSRKKRFELLFK